MRRLIQKYMDRLLPAPARVRGDSLKETKPTCALYSGEGNPRIGSSCDENNDHHAPHTDSRHSCARARSVPTCITRSVSCHDNRACSEPPKERRVHFAKETENVIPTALRSADVKNESSALHSATFATFLRLWSQFDAPAYSHDIWPDHFASDKVRSLKNTYRAMVEVFYSQSRLPEQCHALA